MRRPGRHSPLWKTWKKIGSGRDNRFFLEHPDAVFESLAQGQIAEQYLVAESRLEAEPELFQRLAEQSGRKRWYVLADTRLDEVVSVPTTGGFCGVFSPRPRTLQEMLACSFLLVGCQLSDPGNVGTVIRSCWALAGGGVILLGGCNPWSSKVARASAGALLRAPIAFLKTEAEKELCTLLEQAGFRLHSAVPRGGESNLERFEAGKDAFFLGNESRGIGDEILQRSTALTIPMKGESDSLNVAMASTILAWVWTTSQGWDRRRSPVDKDCEILHNPLREHCSKNEA